MQRSQPPRQVPKYLSLVWGSDKLQILDAAWAEALVGELNRDVEDSYLESPGSRSDDDFHETMAALGMATLPESVRPRVPRGFQRPDQPPVAAAAMKAFLNLELPTALNFVNFWGRSELRLTALRAVLQISQNFGSDSREHLELTWRLQGFQLYASHHVGRQMRRPVHTSSPFATWIERRGLNGLWAPWSFEGLADLPEDIWERDRMPRRKFTLHEGGALALGDQLVRTVPL